MGEPKLRMDKDKANGAIVSKLRVVTYSGLVGVIVAGVAIAAIAIRMDGTSPVRQDALANTDAVAADGADGPTGQGGSSTSGPVKRGYRGPDRASPQAAGPDLPTPDVPLDQAVAALLPLAEAGRSDAMYALAMRLVECPRTIRDDTAIRKDKTRLFYWYNGHEPSSDEEITKVASQVEQAARRRDECTLIDPALVAASLSWLEKSAIAGNTQAMLDYARRGLSDGMGREEILMNFEEVARRRTLAGEFLDNALADGDCEALALLASSYSGKRGGMDWVHPPDAGLAYTYAYADAQWRPLDENAHAIADHASESLSFDQRMDAERRGTALSLRCGTAAGL